MTDSESVRKQYTVKREGTIESPPESSDQEKQPAEKIEDILTEEELHVYKRFLATFDVSNKMDLLLSKELVDFIFRQLNDYTLEGYIGDEDLKYVEMRGVTGMSRMTLIQTFESDDMPLGKFHIELMRRRTILESAVNFFHIVLTRIHRGRHLDTKRREIDAKRPPGVILGGK